MEKNVLITLIVALALAAIVASALPAASQTAPGSLSGAADIAAMTTPRAVVLALSSAGVTGGNATFTVPYSAKVFRLGGIDYGLVSSTSAPVRGSFNPAGGTGVLSTADVLPATSTTDYLNRSTIPVAGTNAIIALEDLRMTAGGGGNFIFEAGKLSVYLPGGTANTFTLARPVRMAYSMGQSTLTIETDPAIASTIAGTLGSSVTFPADMKPVPLTSILGTM